LCGALERGFGVALLDAAEVDETRFARFTVAFVESLTAAVLRRVAFFFGGDMTLASRSKPRSQTLDFFLGMAWAVTAKRAAKTAKSRKESGRPQRTPGEFSQYWSTVNPISWIARAGIAPARGIHRKGR
jgi:hypothetical protein